MPKRKQGRPKEPELDSSAVSATKKQVRWGGEEEEVESKEDSKDAVEEEEEEEESHMSEKVRVLVATTNKTCNELRFRSV